MTNHLTDNKIEGYFSIHYRNRCIGKETIKITKDNNLILLNSSTEVKSSRFSVQQKIIAKFTKDLQLKSCTLDGIINKQNISFKIINKQNNYKIQLFDNVADKIKKNNQLETIVNFDFCFSLLSIFGYKSSLVEQEEFELRVLSIPDSYNLKVKKNNLTQVFFGGYEFAPASILFERNYGLTEYIWFNDIGWVNRIANPQMHFLINWNST